MNMVTHKPESKTIHINESTKDLPISQPIFMEYPGKKPQAHLVHLLATVTCEVHSSQMCQDAEPTV